MKCLHCGNQAILGPQHRGQSYCYGCATMSASEAAQALSISRNTYYRRVKDGTIKPFRVGLGRMRVKRSDVAKLLSESNTY